MDPGVFFFISTFKHFTFLTFSLFHDLSIWQSFFFLAVLYMLCVPLDERRFSHKQGVKLNVVTHITVEGMELRGG